eukprot:796790-Alexandrium_andersonii.AAC.2
MATRRADGTGPRHAHAQKAGRFHRLSAPPVADEPYPAPSGQGPRASWRDMAHRLPGWTPKPQALKTELTNAVQGTCIAGVNCSGGNAELAALDGVRNIPPTSQTGRCAFDRANASRPFPSILVAASAGGLLTHQQWPVVSAEGATTGEVASAEGRDGAPAGAWTCTGQAPTGVFACSRRAARWNRAIPHNVPRGRDPNPRPNPRRGTDSQDKTTAGCRTRVVLLCKLRARTPCAETGRRGRSRQPSAAPSPGLR